MRVVIRSCTDKKFFACKEQWVTGREHALDFVSSVAALNVANRLHLENIEIVLDFESGANEVVLTVPPPDALKRPTSDKR